LNLKKFGLLRGETNKKETIRETTVKRVIQQKALRLLDVVKKTERKTRKRGDKSAIRN
jgi:hypothetical protein